HVSVMKLAVLQSPEITHILRGGFSCGRVSYSWSLRLLSWSSRSRSGTVPRGPLSYSFTPRSRSRCWVSRMLELAHDCCSSRRPDGDRPLGGCFSPRTSYSVP